MPGSCWVCWLLSPPVFNVIGDCTEDDRVLVDDWEDFRRNKTFRLRLDDGPAMNVVFFRRVTTGGVGDFDAKVVAPGLMSP